MATETELDWFDIHRIKPGNTILIVGRRGEGKSTLLQDLMFALKRQFHSGIAMSPTPETIEDFKKFMPASFCYDDYNRGAIARLLETKKNLQIRWGGEDHDHKHLFLLMDDCMYDPRCMKDTWMRKMYMNGRHAKVLFINLVQYIKDMPPALRVNVDFIFAFQQNSRGEQEKLFKEYFGVFRTFADFNAAFNLCTENRECIVLDNTSKSKRLSDKVFYYKARVNLPRFRVGGPSWWLWDWRYGKQDTTKADVETTISKSLDIYNPASKLTLEEANAVFEQEVNATNDKRKGGLKGAQTLAVKKRSPPKRKQD